MVEYIDPDFATFGRNVSEVFETISETYATDSATATVTLKCNWDDRKLLVDRILRDGYGWIPDTAESRVGAMFPASSSSLSEMEAQQVEVRPLATAFTDDGQACNYKYALITIHYAANVPTVSIQPSSEWLTINPDGLQWGGDVNLPLSWEEAPGFILHSHSISITRKRVRLADFNFLEFEGCVNKDEIYEPEFFPMRYPAGTLLCENPTITRHLTGDLHDVTITLNYRKIPWNLFFHPLANRSETNATLLDRIVPIIDRSTGESVKIAPEIKFNKLLYFLGIGVNPDTEE